MSDMVYIGSLTQKLSERGKMAGRIKELSYNLDVLLAMDGQWQADTRRAIGNVGGDPRVFDGLPGTTWGITRKLKNLTRPSGSNVPRAAQYEQERELSRLARSGAIDEVFAHGSDATRARARNIIEGYAQRGGPVAETLQSRLERLQLTPPR